MRDTGYRILADGVQVSNDTWATGLGNHDLIIGPTGGGKTRGYVLPNLLSTQESCIVADSKGTLRRQVGGILERRGFRVMELDFTDLLHSPWGYNPLRFIRWDEQRGCWNEQDGRRAGAGRGQDAAILGVCRAEFAGGPYQLHAGVPTSGGA